MSEKIKVENEPIYRDSQNGALIFTNKIEIQEYEAIFNEDFLYLINPIHLRN